MNMSQHYNMLYDTANELLREYNPCRFNDKGECIRYQSGLRWPDANDKACCGGSSTHDGKPCKYLTGKGCRAKALWCKMWLCRYAWDKMPKGFQLQWQHLYRTSIKAFVISGRNCKAEVMEDTAWLNPKHR